MPGDALPLDPAIRRLLYGGQLPRHVSERLEALVGTEVPKYVDGDLTSEKGSVRGRLVIYLEQQVIVTDIDGASDNVEGERKTVTVRMFGRSSCQQVVLGDRSGSDYAWDDNFGDSWGRNRPVEIQYRDQEPLYLPLSPSEVVRRAFATFLPKLLRDLA